jgi:hypothetical protein
MGREKQKPRFTVWRRWLVEQPARMGSKRSAGEHRLPWQGARALRAGGPVFLYVGRYMAVKRLPCGCRKLGFPANRLIRRRRIGILALAGSGLRQTDALIEACSSDSSAA